MAGRTARRMALIAASALLVVIAPFAILGEISHERWFAAADGEELAYGMAGAGLLLADALLPVPSSVVGTLLGAKLGWTAGFLWAWLGLAAGNLAGYAGGRFWPERSSARMPSAPGALLVFSSRSIPVLAETVALAAGATRMPPVDFLLASLAGSAVYAFALAGCGAALLPAWLLGPVLIGVMLVPLVVWAARQLAAAMSGARAGKDGPSR